MNQSQTKSDMSDGQSSNNAHRSIIIGKCTVDMGYNSLYFARSFFFSVFYFQYIFSEVG